MHAIMYGTSVRVAGHRDVLVESVKDTAVGMYDRAVALRTRDRIADVAKKRNQDPGQVYASLQKANRLSEIERSITEERVFAWLLERNTVE